MAETFSPQYTSDSFIPIPSERNNDLNAQNNERHSYIRNRPQCSFRENVRNSFSESSYVPWKRASSYSYGVVGLHEEIEDFYEKMHPTEQEGEIRLRVVEHVTKIVHSLWPLAKVEVFGSFRTGLYLPSSDIDMVVIGEWRSLPLSTLSQALQQNGISESDINIIANATVPIIRFKHTPSRIGVDISFNLTNGIKSAKLVKKLIKQYPSLPKLVVVLKQFLVQRGLNEVYNGGMSSYCLTLLIVSLLQGYHKPKSLASRNLGTLLLEFFEHYGINFNYENVSIHFPNETGGMYQPKYKANNLLSIEDPLVRGELLRQFSIWHDVAKGTYLMHALKQAFENAFFVLHKAMTDSAAEKRPLNSYLSLIVKIDDKLWEERKWMAQNCPLIIRKLSEPVAGNNETDKVAVKKKQPSETGKVAVKKKHPR